MSIVHPRPTSNRASSSSSAAAQGGQYAAAYSRLSFDAAGSDIGALLPDVVNMAGKANIAAEHIAEAEDLVGWRSGGGRLHRRDCERVHDCEKLCLLNARLFATFYLPPPASRRGRRWPRGSHVRPRASFADQAAGDAGRTGCFQL